MEVMRITPIVRAALFTAWGGKCAYCGEEPEHVDHIYPKAKGGRDELENYAPACRRCNLRKSDMVFDEKYAGFMLQLARRHAPEAKRLMRASVKKRSSRDHMIQRIRRRVTTIDLDLPLAVIDWLASERGAEAALGELSMITFDLGGRRDVYQAFQRAKPRWKGPFHSGPLILSMTRDPSCSVVADPLLLRAATIASILRLSAFEFDGEELPTDITACRAAEYC